MVEIESVGEMKGRAQDYQRHLDSVSRSFAFCIARLEGRPRELVGLAYLLCRILDTIEDSNWASAEAQLQAFEAFDEFVANPASLGTFKFQLWLKSFPADINSGEKALIDDAELLLRDYHELPADIKNVFASVLRSMSSGMQYFAQKRDGGVLRLRSVRELNLYCFFVAGVIGELLTTIFQHSKHIDQEHLGDAFHFGLLLQKINVLKDQIQDEESGRYLVPMREEVLQSLRVHVTRALRYITRIPENNPSFRLFCAWSIGLAAASFPYIERSFRERRPIKIPRSETGLTLSLIEASIAYLPKDFEKRMREVLQVFGVTEEDRVAKISEGAIPSLYQGILSQHELGQLDMAELV